MPSRILKKIKRRWWPFRPGRVFGNFLPRLEELARLRIVPDSIYRRLRDANLVNKLNAIILVSAGPIIIILLIIFVLLYFQISSQIDQDMRQKMISVQKTFNYFERQTRVYAKMLAENPYIKKELLADTINSGPILRVCQQVQDSVFLDQITVHDRSGVVVVKSHDQVDFGAAEGEIEFIRSALRDGKNSARLRLEPEGLVLQNTVPVSFSGEIVGTITAGYILNHRFARRVRETTRANIFYTVNGKIISSSLGRVVPPRGKDANLEYTETNRSYSLTRKIDLWSPEGKKTDTVKLDFRAIPIVTRHAAKIKSASILVGLDQSQPRLYLTLLLTISVTLSAIIFFLALVFALKISRGIAHFAHKISQGMQAFQEGHHDTRLEILSRDELGTVAEGFNTMAAQLQLQILEIRDARDNLEEKVRERTRELESALREVTSLKDHQEGDYFLTSILMSPLFINNNHSEKVKTDYLVRQKKKFHFRGRRGEIGGDLCVTDQLNFERGGAYTFFFNGDAMGKSSQGAGGVLVCGTTLHSILNRSRGKTIRLDPVRWLANVYFELHKIFSTFDGSMLMSGVCGIVNEETGMMHYFNSEHPWTVLYRDGQASFIEEECMVKMGVNLPGIRLVIKKFQLEAGDILITGSDGRDDIIIEEKETEYGDPIINSDETLFLRRVEEAVGDLEKITHEIQARGKLTDDLSLLRVFYQPNPL